MINLPFQKRQDAWQIKLCEIPAGRILELVQKKTRLGGWQDCMRMGDFMITKNLSLKLLMHGAE
jgi:hypothetical protein